MTKVEQEIEESLVRKLRDLKYEYRPDIRDREALEKNFREKFQALNRVTLTDAEFARLLEEIVTSDVYEAAQSLRNWEAFTRDDGTPLNYTLVNIKDWCKNAFEVVNQLRINTDNSYHRYGRHTLDQRHPRRSDRAEGAWDQPAAGDAANRRLQERSR